MKFLIFITTVLIYFLFIFATVIASPIIDEVNPTEEVKLDFQLQPGINASFKGTTDDYEYIYDDEDLENASSQECDDGEFWHLIGRQCVPEQCHYGRIPETGECLSFPSFTGTAGSTHKRHKYTYRYRYRYGNSRNISSRYNVVRRPGGRG